MEEHRPAHAEQIMEESFQIPIVATLFFIFTMLAIYFMGSAVMQLNDPSNFPPPISRTVVPIP